MRPPGRSQGEYRSPLGGGCLMRPPGRSQGEYRSPLGGGCLMRRRAAPKANTAVRSMEAAQ